MTVVSRVLDPEPVMSWEAYLASGGGTAVRRAADLGPADVLDLLDASGLRGRGGAGFPTGRKWRTVVAYESDVALPTVVVNAAEGEPGCLKDRTLLLTNPYRVLEGALVAARTVGSDAIVVATKRTFTDVVARLSGAIAEMTAAGFFGDVGVDLFEGPTEYLFGEETGLLESIDGRYPFPRIAPPFRRGVVEIVEGEGDVDSETKSAAHVEMAGTSDDAIGDPALVDNVETLANVTEIVARGASWYRELGSEQSPGTIVCTVTGDTVHAGIAEIALGTTLRDAIAEVGGGPQPGRSVKAVMSGVSGAFVPAEQLDTPLTYEDMAGTGAGLGAGGYLVVDDTADMVAVAAGAIRFLAIESCGQCRACKQEGLALMRDLTALAANEANTSTLKDIRKAQSRVANGARCNLGRQEEAIVGSLLDRYSNEIEAHLNSTVPAVQPAYVAPIVGIREGTALLSPTQATKQPDWSHDVEYGGQWPADVLDDHRVSPAEL